MDLNTTSSLSPSVASFLRWRFWFAAGLLVLASFMFFETGSAAPMQPAKWLFCLSVSFVVTATIAWEWKAFGNPRILSNTVLHALLFAALACMLLRLRGHVGERDWSLLGLVAGALDWANKVLGFFPPVLFELLRSPAVALLFLGVCLALCFVRHGHLVCSHPFSFSGWLCHFLAMDLAHAAGSSVGWLVLPFRCGCNTLLPTIGISGSM